MNKLIGDVNLSDKLTSDEKKLVIFAFEKQQLLGECITTNAELVEELELTPYKIKKITK